jgi:hypothetical protein
MCLYRTKLLKHGDICGLSRVFTKIVFTSSRAPCFDGKISADKVKKGGKIG